MVIFEARFDVFSGIENFRLEKAYDFVHRCQRLTCRWMFVPRIGGRLSGGNCLSFQIAARSGTYLPDPAQRSLSDCIVLHGFRALFVGCAFYSAHLQRS